MIFKLIGLNKFRYLHLIVSDRWLPLG